MRRAVLLTILALVGSGLSRLAAQGVNPPGSPADHFLSYKIKITKRTAKFAPLGGIHLVDAFEDRSFDVLALSTLYVPANKNDEGIVDPAMHLLGYKIKVVKGASKFVPHKNLQVVDQFGAMRLDAVKPELLLVPTAKNFTLAPPAPDPMQHNVDHYTCYAAKVSKGTKFQKGLQVRVADQPPTPAKIFDVQAPRHLCLPVDKKGEGIKNRTGSLTCYKVKAAKKQPKFVKRTGVHVNNQLGPLTLDTAAEVELCLPSVVQPAGCGDGAVNQSGEQCDPPGSACGNAGTCAADCTCLLPRCGDGILNAGEECDGGAADACPGQCRNDCTCPPCGDGILNSPSEQCEPPGSSCANARTCTVDCTCPLPSCGDGILDAGEECDGAANAACPAHCVDCLCSTVPPDPSDVAPPVDDGVATTIGKSTVFLYTGPNPIQTGVAPGTIDPTRAAVVRGRVLDGAGAPLPAVRVRILEHPELGETLSRADGMFDLAVNGGGTLTVQYEKAGLLPAQRPVEVPWEDFVVAPDVMLIALDSHMTTIDLSSNAPLQMARGGAMNDADGARQATLLFRQGTEAQMVMPDGSTQVIATLNVRATEYTVGANGPMAMPGALPPTSGYTYAVELSDDAAMAAGASEVRFSQPVIQYVENFVGFPVGSLVPTGFYDRTAGRWVASDNGLVIGIVGITSGHADVDADGDGTADDAAALLALGITDAERQQLAALYTPGESLWRVLIPHFSPWDFNWPYGPPDDGIPPKPKPRRPDKPPKGPDPDCERGSLIGCETQTLGESRHISGTPYTLHYRSDRVPGRRASTIVQTKVSEGAVPASLVGISVEISVAGRFFRDTLTPAPNLIHTFAWDGKDAYGRAVQGVQPVKVRVGYVYVAQYYATPASFAASFNRFGLPPISTARGGGAAPTFSRTQARGTSSTVTVYGQYETEVESHASAQEVGGWTFDVHHTYDVSGRILHLGDGPQRSADGAVSAISTVAGRGPSIQNGVPATQAHLFALDLTVGPDGSVYWADVQTSRVRRIGPDGIVTTIAGGPPLCGTPPCGEGGPATQAGLNLQSFGSPGVAVGPDGSLYFTDSVRYIRRIAPDGILTTIAGNGSACTPSTAECGDGGPARQAAMTPSELALGPDGSIYFLELGPRVRRVSPDGIVTTVAGTGVTCNFGTQPCGDGGPATAAQLGSTPAGIAVAPDGSFYIADPNFGRVRRVTPDGVIRNFAGTGTVCSSPFAVCGDGGPATQAQFRNPIDVALGPDGSVYIADLNAGRFRRVGTDGIIRTVAGNGNSDGADGDGGFPTGADTPGARAVAVAPDGRVYLVHPLSGGSLIRLGASTWPGIQAGEFPLASTDGTDVYIFSGAGRHLRTLDALTGGVRLTFGYDGSDRLITVTDAYDETTTVERDGNGDPTAIVAPGGQRTTLTTNADGYLSSIANPAGQSVQLTYGTGLAEGLLATLTDARANVHHLTYDALGLLVQDENPAGGVTTLSRTDVSTERYMLTIATAAGLQTTYDIEDLPTGETRRTRVAPSGATTVTLVGTNGVRRTTYPDGTITDLVLGPDPRWGLQAPVVVSKTSTTPNGRVQTLTNSRVATLADPTDLSSLQTLTATRTSNGRTSTLAYQSNSKTLTLTTPTGRKVTATLDTQGRVVSTGVVGSAPNALLTYDLRGRLTQAARDTRTLTLGYAPNNFLASITNQLGTAVSFGRDAVGRTTSITGPDGAVVGIAYDASGNVTALTPPGRSPHLLAYDGTSRLTSMTPPDLGPGSEATTFTRDLDGRVTSIGRPDATVTIGLDGGGRRLHLTLPGDSVDAAYDSGGRLASLTTGAGVGLAYQYDGQLLTRSTWSGPVVGRVDRTYDNAFRVTQRSVNGGNAIDLSYDNDGLPTQAGALAIQRSAVTGLVTGTTLGNLTDTVARNGFGELTSYGASFNASPLLSLAYGHDEIGRVSTLTETIAGVTRVYEYAYDDAGRLGEVIRDGSTLATYTYDTNGNRLTGPGAGGPFTYDAQDRLLQRGATSYSYTANGDVATKTTGPETVTYVHDALGRLRSVTKPGTAVEYVIDGRGRRIGKRLNGTLVQGLLYEGGAQPMAELDGNNALVSVFAYGTRTSVPDYFVKLGVTYRILADVRGSPRLVIRTSDGVTVQRLDYDELGRVVLDTSPGFQPFGFAGGLYDPDTGLVRFGVRDYDPDAGRWVRKDPSGLAAGSNPYVYAHDDPVNWVDRTGHEAAAITAGTLGAGATGGLGVGTALALGAGVAVGGAFFAAGAYAAVIAAPGLFEDVEGIVEQHADGTKDDEGPEEGGVPDDTTPDGGSCPVPNIMDDKLTGDRDDPVPLKPGGGSEEEENARKEEGLIPRGKDRDNNWRTPRIPYPETPEDGFDLPPPGGTLD